LNRAGRPRILIIGPYPPPLGGVTVECATLTSCLSEYSDRAAIDKFNTNLSVIQLFLQLPGFMRQIFRADSLFIYGSHRRVSLFAIVFIPFLKLLGKRQVVKITGGNFREYYQSCNRFLKFLFGKTLFNASVMLLETKYLVNSFQSAYPRVQWFPMTRVRSGEMLVYGQASDTGQEQAHSHSNNPDNSRDFASTDPNLKVVFLGHVNESKGVSLLLEVAEDLEGIQVDVFGEFKDKSGVPLDQSDFQGKKTQYKGIVQPAELTELLNKYDVLVLPTHYSGEGYPGVIIEAKRSGLAVVTTQWRSIPEIVEHDVTGLLVEPGSHHELLDALQSLRNDRELLKRLKQASYKSFSEFDCHIWCEKLLQHLIG